MPNDAFYGRVVFKEYLPRIYEFRRIAVVAGRVGAGTSGALRNRSLARQHGEFFVPAAVIMQINTDGNLFKYRNKRPSRRRRRALPPSVIYESSPEK